jgi:hypothetical protein
MRIWVGGDTLEGGVAAPNDHPASVSQSDNGASAHRQLRLPLGGMSGRASLDRRPGPKERATVTKGSRPRRAAGLLIEFRHSSVVRGDDQPCGPWSGSLWRSCSAEPSCSSLALVQQVSGSLWSRSASGCSLSTALGAVMDMIAPSTAHSPRSGDHRPARRRAAGGGTHCLGANRKRVLP